MTNTTSTNLDLLGYDSANLLTSATVTAAPTQTVAQLIASKDAKVQLDAVLTIGLANTLNTYINIPTGLTAGGTLIAIETNNSYGNGGTINDVDGYIKDIASYNELVSLDSPAWSVSASNGKVTWSSLDKNITNAAAADVVSLRSVGARLEHDVVTQYY